MSEMPVDRARLVREIEAAYPTHGEVIAALIEARALVSTLEIARLKAMRNGQSAGRADQLRPAAKALEQG